MKKDESTAAETEMEDTQEKKKKGRSNDIRDIRSIRQLEKVKLDFDSPRLRQAMDDLGVSFEECQKK